MKRNIEGKGVKKDAMTVIALHSALLWLPSRNQQGQLFVILKEMIYARWADGKGREEREGRRVGEEEEKEEGEKMGDSEGE